MIFIADSKLVKSAVVDVVYKMLPRIEFPFTIFFMVTGLTVILSQHCKITRYISPSVNPFFPPFILRLPICIESHKETLLNKGGIWISLIV